MRSSVPNDGHRRAVDDGSTARPEETRVFHIQRRTVLPDAAATIGPIDWRFDSSDDDRSPISRSPFEHPLRGRNVQDGRVLNRDTTDIQLNGSGRA
jgi:hypothetical protein